MKAVSLLVCFSALVLLTNLGIAWQVEEKETIEETLRFSDSSAKKELVVDNINGSIEVNGYDGRDVQLIAHRTIVARSREKLAAAYRQVQLEILEEGNSIVLFVDAPYRQRDGSINYRGWRYYGFKVQYDFEIRVPKETDISLKTINGGEIRVRDVHGDFELDNINGGVEMLGAAGSGRVHALNGGVHVQFDRNPRSECFFGSLNGEIEVAFQPGLSADLRFKTFNGEVYTDFPVTYLNPRKPTHKRENGRFVYKSDRSFGARVGDGGPEIEFDGFNGNILVVKQ